jgi:hypothetical protein
MGTSAASAPDKATPPHLEQAWLRQLVEGLSAIHRPSASPGEREAAEWLLARLAEHGVEGEIESEPAHGTSWWPLGIAAAAGALGGFLALRGKRGLGALIAGAAGAAAIDDLPPHGKRRLRKLLPHGERSQVVAQIGPEDAERTVVVMAHHDAPRSGLLYSPAIPEFIFERVLPAEALPDTSPPLMWLVVGGPLTVAAGGLVGSRVLTKAGTALSAGTAAVLADVGRSEVVPGANDNASGVAALISVARALSENPPEGLRVMFVSTSEEATCDGIAAFAERHFAELPPDRTFFLCLESVGSPRLAVLRGEGMLSMTEYPRRSLALLDGLAGDLDIELEPNLRNRNATDAVTPLAAGYECAAIVSVTQLHQISNYHWPTDTPDRVNYATVADAARLSEAVVRRLGELWFST